MRQTFDRLVGPVAIILRALPAVPGATSKAVPHLVPTDLDRWRVVAGTRPTGQLRVDIAELRRARNEEIARAASRLGLRAQGPAVDSERAATLVRAVKNGYAASDPAPFRDPLVRYPAGEDPRPMWKTHVDSTFFTRDINDAIADIVAKALRVLRAADRAEDWERCAARAARLWVASAGAGRLYRITMAEMRRTPRLEATDWVILFAHALLRSSTSAKDLRVHWHSLAQLAPLLAVLAESNRAGREQIRVAANVFDRADEWRTLTVEVNGWIDALDELAVLDDELALRRQGQKVSTVGIKKAVTRLHEALRPRGLLLYHRIHDLEADDTGGIRASLERVVSDRLEACGIGADTPPGALIGSDAAVLLSIQAALTGRRCIECGRPAQPGRARCTEHQRAAWRARKAKDRKANARRPRESAGRTRRGGVPRVSSRRSGSPAAPSPSRASRKHPSRNR